MYTTHKVGYSGDYNGGSGVATLRNIEICTTASIEITPLMSCEKQRKTNAPS